MTRDEEIELLKGLCAPQPDGFGGESDPIYVDYSKLIGLEYDFLDEEKFSYEETYIFSFEHEVIVFRAWADTTFSGVNEERYETMDDALRHLVDWERKQLDKP